jgi:hypothetical protein
MYDFGLRVYPRVPTLWKKCLPKRKEILAVLREWCNLARFPVLKVPWFTNCGQIGEEEEQRGKRPALIRLYSCTWVTLLGLFSGKGSVVTYKSLRESESRRCLFMSVFILKLGECVLLLR